MADTYLQSRPAKVEVGSDMESILFMMHAMKEQMDSMQTMIKTKIDETAELKEYFAGFEKLVRRRFDEISMEINATSQQLDMTEEGLATRFGEIVNTLAAITYSGGGITAANTGVELEAVIIDTEDAANKILDAADRISQRIRNDQNLSAEEARTQFLESTKADVQEILMACTFQDLTGQRIRKTLESIQLIEDRISSTLGKMGIETKPDALAGGVEDSTKNHATSQSDIDALFA